MQCAPQRKTKAQHHSHGPGAGLSKGAVGPQEDGCRNQEEGTVNKKSTVTLETIRKLSMNRTSKGIKVRVTLTGQGATEHIACA